jgi:hypothetical protein
LGRNKDQLTNLLGNPTSNNEIEDWFSDSKANVPAAETCMLNTYAAAGSDTTSTTLNNAIQS